MSPDNLASAGRTTPVRSRHGREIGATRRARENMLRLELVDGCLYAANTGQEFHRAGVVSICTQNLSAKSARADKIATLSCPDEELVEAIRELQVQVYRLNPNLLIADRNAEDETSSDYAGRSLLELLQNADDAMAPPGTTAADLIGAKGLGFKAVLEVTDTPQIFSGPFSFGFDSDRSREALAGLDVADEVCVFRIPHPVPRDAVVTRLLKSGFSTVIKLPLRDKDAEGRATIELRDLRPHFLLLAQHLDCVDLPAGTQRRRLSRRGPRGSPDGADAMLEVSTAGRLEHQSRWRVWREVWPPKDDLQKRLSVSLAMEVRDGRLVPTDQPLPLHVFYPTEEDVGTNFLLHASFDVVQNRQRVRPSRNDAALLKALGDLAGRIAAAEQPVEVLEVVRRLVAQAPRGRPKLLARLIPYVIRQALLDAPLVPIIGRSGSRAPPRLARISAIGFASLLGRGSSRVAEFMIAKRELEPVYAVLQDLESSALQSGDYARLFRYVQCQTSEACVTATRIMLRTCLAGYHVAPSILAVLREAPVWAIAGGGARRLSDPRPLLMAMPTDWPRWCPADALDPSFGNELFPRGTIPREWEKLVGGTLLTNTDQFLEKCLAPAVEAWPDNGWIGNGWEALELVAHWADIGEWAKLQPYAPNGSPGGPRDALVRVMRVPSGKLWVRARQCYARTEIKGAAGLSQYFRQVPGRFLCGYPAEAKQRFGAEQWRALLRYLGVSWEPKILLFENDPDAVTGAAEQSDYRGEIYRRDGLRYLKRDWQLEAFPDCLGNNVPAATLMEMVASLQLTSAGLRAEWFKVTGTEKTHAPQAYRSFVDFQLRCVPFVPVRPNIWGKSLAAGRETFWPQTGISGITLDMDLAGFKDPRRSTLRPLLSTALRFQTKLPEQWGSWLPYHDALVAAVERGEVPRGLHSARELYEHMLDPRNGGRDGAKPRKLACSDPQSPTGLRAVSRGDASWIDKPALAAPEVLDALTAAGLAYIPALLDAAPNANDQLGIARASEKVTIIPTYEEAQQAQGALKRRLEARWRAIAVQCEAKRVRVPTKPRLRAVHGLTLAISFDGKHAAEIASVAFRQVDEWLIDVGNREEAIAMALTDGIGHAADLRYRFAAVLRAPNADAVTRILLEDGIPSYKLAAVRLDLEGEEGSGSQEDGEQADNDEDPAGGNAKSEPGEGEQDERRTDDAAIEPEPSDPSSTNRPAGNHHASGTLAHRPLYDPAGGNAGSGSGSGAWGNQRAAGIAGEEWLRRLVLATLPPGWTAALNERDKDRGESDIVVRSPTAEWHIEVKTLSSQRLYWSNQEREKAERQRDRYWMCFLVREAYAWRIHWSWDPLVDLLPCERRVQWQWSSEIEGPRLEKDSWNPIGGTAIARALSSDKWREMESQVDERLEELVYPYAEHFIGYGTDSLIDETFFGKAYAEVALSEEYDNFHYSTKLGGITFQAYKLGAAFTVAMSLRHRHFVDALLAKEPSIKLENILTVSVDTPAYLEGLEIAINDFGSSISDHTNIGAGEARTIFDVLSIHRGNTELLDRPGAPFPPLIQCSEGHVIRSIFGARSDIMLFLLNSLKFHFPDDYNEAQRARERPMQLAMKRVLKEALPGLEFRDNVKIRVAGRVVTDVDLVVIEPSTGTIVLCELKHQDRYGADLAARRERTSRLKGQVEKWLAGVQSWLATTDELVLRSTLRIPKEIKQPKFELLIVARHFAHVLNDLAVASINYGNWTQVVHALTLMRQKFGVGCTIGQVFESLAEVTTPSGEEQFLPEPTTEWQVGALSFRIEQARD